MAEPVIADENTASVQSGEDQNKGSEGGNTEGDSKPAVPSGEDYQPPLRKSPLDYIKERKERKLESIKSKEIDEISAQIDNAEDEVGRKVREEVSKVLDPVGRLLQDSADDREISDFLTKNPDFKKYEAHAKKDVKAYPNLPIEKIFRSLAYDDAMANGATRSIEAKAKAKAQSLGGSARRPEAGASNLPNFAKMSPKELSEFNLRVAQGERFETE